MAIGNAFYGAVNGLRVSSSYLYKVNAAAISYSTSTVNNGISTISTTFASGTISSYSQLSFVGTVAITLNSVNDFITVGNNSYVVYGVSSDGQDLIYGSVAGPSFETYVLSNSGRAPNGPVSFTSTSGVYVAASGPAITALALPSVVNVTHDASTSFGVSAADVGSSVARVSITLDHAIQTAAGSTTTLNFLDTVDSFSDGSSSLVQRLSSLNGAGTYSIASLSVTDNAGKVAQYTGASLASFGLPTTFTLTKHAVAADFSGDGHSDIMWQNVSGAVSEWTVEGNVLSDQLHTGVFNSPVPAGWSIVESFDMNGDGVSDLLWRNPTGAVSVWDGTGGGGFQAGAYNSTALPADWHVAAVGDFNGDGRDDILWRQEGGAVSLWTSTGTEFQAGTYNTSVPTDWKIEGAADFNGDGKSDILWRNASGEFSTWLSTGTGFQIGAYDNTAVPTLWHIRGLADFNGDGKDDILWYSDTGAVSVWTSNGTGFDIGTINDAVPSNWTIAAVGDYNNDGKADILWHSDTGQTSIWDGTGTGFIKGVANANIPTDWHVVAHDFLL